MQAEILELHHRDFLQPRLKKLQVPLSSYSFANVYLWRHRGGGQCEVLRQGDHIFLRGKTFDGERYLMPTAHPRDWAQGGLEDLEGEYDCLFPIPEAWLSFFPEERFRRRIRRAERDYVFPTAQMASFPGRKLAGKRNLVAQFRRDHQPEGLGLLGHEREALEVLEQWQGLSDLDSKSTDYFPCREALQRLDVLGLEGRVVVVDGHVVGFTLGEALTDEVFVVRFAKADRAHKGAYQFLFQDMALQQESSYLHFNIEEDLGISAIRKSKASYRPTHLANKVRLYPEP